jgi:hypothetical protein
MEGYWEVDDLENAIDYLEMIHHFLTKVESDWKWKWVIISTHQALYSFGLCALAGTSAAHTVTDRGTDKGRSKRQKINQAKALSIEGNTREQIANALGVSLEKAVELLAEEPHVLDVWAVIERLQDKANLPWGNSQPLRLQPEQDRALRTLVDSRNKYEHYYPIKRWRININKVSDTIRKCMPIIEFIAIDSNCISYNREEPQSIKVALRQIKEALQRYSAEVA